MKRCPFCAEEIQDAAIVCKHCGRDLPATPGVIQDKPVKSKPNRRVLAMILVLLLGMCAFCVWGIPAQNAESDAQETIAALTQSSTPTPSRTPTETPQPTATNDPNSLNTSDYGTFIFLSEDYVRQALVAPSTADFPGLVLELDQWRMGKSNNIVSVQSWVDAQNSFGAMIRSYFTAQFDYFSQELLYLEIDGQVVYGTFQPQ